MNRTICILILSCVLHSKAKAEGFDHLDGHTQAYIVKQLSSVIANSDIAILHDRSDEWVRRDPSLSAAQRATLGLTRLRFIKALKGSTNLAHNEVIYIYEPYKKDWHIISEPRQGPIINTPPYRPLFLSDDLMRMVFMQRQLEPIRDRIRDGYQKREPKLKSFVEDALKMNIANDFLAKYDLATMFSNRVYRVMEACIFRVDYQPPDMPLTELMQMNRKALELEQARIPDLQKMTNLVPLTKREVSEIVLLAYLLDGDQGLVKYATATKENVILEPINEIVFKTIVGKKLFETLRARIKLPTEK